MVQVFYIFLITIALPITLNIIVSKLDTNVNSSITKGLIMSLISKNFNEAINKIGIKQSDLAKKYNISRQMVNKFTTNQKTITNKFAEICDKENINIHWILTKRGKMFITDYNNHLVDNAINNGNIQLNGHNNGTININSNDELSNEISREIKKLPTKKIEYFYHLIKAETLKDN